MLLNLSLLNLYLTCKCILVFLLLNLVLLLDYLQLWITTSSPDFTNVDVDVPSTFPPAFAFHPELFIAFATSLAVATPSVVGTVTFPAGVVVSADVLHHIYFPAVSTLAVVKFPSSKLNPSANETSFLGAAPFAV